jgi:lipoprotein-anchoring transpeptidase ErfK/SrfK
MRRLILLGAIGALAACSDPSQPQGQAQQTQKAPDAAKVAPPLSDQGPVVPANAAPALALDTTQPGADQVPAPAGGTIRQAAAEPATAVPAATVAGSNDASPLAQAINQAAAPAGAKGTAPAGWSVKGVDPSLVRIEVLLDRAGFSPGVIDGKDGQNLKQAVAAYASAKNLQGDKAVYDALAADSAPAAQTYVITDKDVAGPFIGDPPKDYEALSKLPALGYSTPLQGLAEKFHMDQGLLKALNPGADFGKAGTSIVVAVPRMAPRTFSVARIEVDKSDEAVRAYDASGTLVAYYPATVGSAERPAPSGAFKVIAVAPHPVYFYDPKRLTFTPEGAKGKLKIQAGPNNPVGETWIALNIPTYGIHGAPDPAAIGKRQSHGCVRLTNWDAVELGKAVKKGVKVEFVGTEKKA